MVNFFDYLYRIIPNDSKKFYNVKFYSILRYMVRICANTIIPIYFRMSSKKKYNLHYSSKHLNCIISITSYPKRIDKLWLVIETILRQSIKPNAIILWLSKKQFISIDLLPKNLLKQITRGLKIVLVEDDLRSHKKYYYSLKEYPEYDLITIDDDIFYPNNMISDLLKAHKKFPDAIIARYGFEITRKNNAILPYKNWNPNFNQDQPNFSIFFGSGGGTFFPAYSLPEETLNREVFLDLCLNADDIWLNSMVRLNNKKIIRITKGRNSLLPVLNRNDVPLSSINLNESNNDRQLNDVRNYYIKEQKKDLYHPE